MEYAGKRRMKLGMLDASRRSTVAWQPPGLADSVRDGVGAAQEGWREEEEEAWERRPTPRTPAWTPMDEQMYQEELETGYPFTARAFYVGALALSCKGWGLGLVLWLGRRVSVFQIP
jgi:hypothetical protein